MSKNNFLVSISLILLCACTAKVTERDTAQEDLLRRQRDEAQVKLQQESKDKAELEKQLDRMVRCRKGFEGNLGQRLEKQIKLVRKTQRVQRFDCDNQMTSDKVETVEDPVGSVDLSGIPALVDRGNAVQVTNRHTCNYPDKGFYKTGLISSKPYLRVNRSNTMFDHEVEVGLNLIDLAVCPAAQPTCKTATYVVTLALNVDYEEIALNGIMTDKPTAEFCEREKQRKEAARKNQK